MTPEEYNLGVGTLIANLQSFEFGLRLFLWNRQSLTSWEFVHNLRAGESVEENAFTDYDSLRDLIRKYNSAVKPYAPELQVDPELNDLRDLFAHGRMFNNEPVSPLRLMKFSQGVNHKVTVTHSILVDEAWLAAQASRVHAELEKIAKADDLLRRSAPPRRHSRKIAG
jgi:hypothetical protein